MKMKKAARYLLGMAFGLSAATAFAQGGSSGVGGGGTVVLLPNDQIVLADPYVSRESQTIEKFKFKLPQEVVEEIRIALQSMFTYAGVSSPKFANTFIEKNVSGDQVEYYAVNQIPRNCPYQAPTLNRLPDGSQVTAVACTFGQKTYVIRSIYEKMSIREQAKLIIHESLRRYTTVQESENADQAIATITDGVDLIYRTNRRVLNGERPALSANEVSTLENMGKQLVENKITSIEALVGNKTFNQLVPDYCYDPAWTKNWLGCASKYLLFQVSDYQVAPNGGGLVHRNAKVDPSAYIGMGTILGEKTTMGARSGIVMSDPQMCMNECDLGADVLIKAVSSGRTLAVKMGDQTQLDQVKLLDVQFLFLERDTSIRKSTIWRRSAKMSNQNYGLALKSGARIENMSMLQLKTGATVGDYISYAVFPAASIWMLPYMNNADFWTLSGIKIDGKRPSNCPGGQYAFLRRQVNSLTETTEQLWSACMKEKKIRTPENQQNE